MQFVQTVADLTARPQNIEILQKAGKKLMAGINNTGIGVKHCAENSVKIFPSCQH